MWSFGAAVHPLIAQVCEEIGRRTLDLGDKERVAPPSSLGFRESGPDDYQLHAEGLHSQLLHFRSPLFSKAHVELTHVGPRFAYVHAMFFPQHDRAYPLFGVDVNATPKKVTLAVIHLYPSPTNVLPRGLNDIFGIDDISFFERHRPLPEWGAVFQEGLCSIVQPQNQAECDHFLRLVQRVSRGYFSKAHAPDPDRGLADSIRARQSDYSRHKRRNTSGAKVLERALGAKVAEVYVRDHLWPTFDMEASAAA